MSFRDWRRWRTVSRKMEITDDDEEEELMVDVDFQEPMTREFVDGIMEEPLDADEPITMT